MNNILKFMGLILMAPDTNGGDNPPAPPAEPPAAPPGDPAPPTPPAEPPIDPRTTDPEDLPPKYHSQLSPAKRESDDYKKYVYKNKGLDDLADDYISMAKRLEGALELPKKGATQEDMKNFLVKLGVPESADKYQLNNKLAEKNPLYKDVESQMKEFFWKTGLTQRQAQTMWNKMSEGWEEATTMIAKEREAEAKSFDERLNAELAKKYESKTDLEAATAETETLFKQHLTRTGLGDLYKSSGLLYNTRFVLAMAAEEKARSGNTLVQGDGGPKKTEGQGMFGNNYSDDFAKMYGKK